MARQCLVDYTTSSSSGDEDEIILTVVLPIADEDQASNSMPGKNENQEISSYMQRHLTSMGFDAEAVRGAIEANGTASEDMLVEHILQIQVLHADSSGQVQQEFTKKQQIPGEDQAHRKNSRKENSIPNIVDVESTSFQPFHLSRCVQLWEEMGFSRQLIEEAIHRFGDQEPDMILDDLFALKELNGDSTNGRSNEEEDTSETDMFTRILSMGYESSIVEKAITICGDVDEATLVDWIDAFGNEDFALQDAAEIQEETDSMMEFDWESSSDESTEDSLKVKHVRLGKRKRPSNLDHLKPHIEHGDHQRLTGFGLPGYTPMHRSLPAIAAGSPYFYFENVQCMPGNEWYNISRHLFGIQPEFVCSQYFSACRRPRGYIHNLPLNGRKAISQSKTIKQVFPQSVSYWPDWDTREKLNTISTTACPVSAARRVARLSEPYIGRRPPDNVIKQVLYECKKRNLIWVGPNQLAPLEAHEVEACLGFDVDHTRGMSRTERLKSLGNSFQVDTVAFHLSVLKDLFPQGVRVLSLFSGIGGAEVALYRLGIPLIYVVSVEKEETNRQILRTWWSKTQPPGRGHHVLFEDITQLTTSVLLKLVKESSGFDLVIGGSPCNNLSGNNRYTRVGLEGEHSRLFYEYPRILKDVRQMMVSGH